MKYLPYRNELEEFYGRYVPMIFFEIEMILHADDHANCFRERSDLRERLAKTAQKAFQDCNDHEASRWLGRLAMEIRLNESRGASVEAALFDGLNSANPQFASIDPMSKEQFRAFRSVPGHDAQLRRLFLFMNRDSQLNTVLDRMFDCDDNCMWHLSETLVLSVFRDSQFRDYIDTAAKECDAEIQRGFCLNQDMEARLREDDSQQARETEALEAIMPENAGHPKPPNTDDQKRNDWLLEQFGPDKDEHPTHAELESMLDAEAPKRDWSQLAKGSIGGALKESWLRQKKCPWPTRLDGRGRRRRPQS